MIFTRKYERLLDPKIGADIQSFLFEPIDSLTTAAIKKAIETTISNYEPRAKIEQVAIDDEPDKNRIKATIYFYVVNSDEPVVVTTFLERLR